MEEAEHTAGTSRYCPTLSSYAKLLCRCTAILCTAILLSEAVQRRRCSTTTPLCCVISSAVVLLYCATLLYYTAVPCCCSAQLYDAKPSTERKTQYRLLRNKPVLSQY
eukprot:1350977-Rhodomonas_salina.1